MKENRSNMVIALCAVAAAVLMCAALSFAIGKWSFGDNGYRVTIKFPNATGITNNAQVKLAGVPVGRVVDIHTVPRKEEDLDPKTNLYNCVDVVISIHRDIELGKDVDAVIKQDGFGISAKYVLLTPGPDLNSPALADNDVIQGHPPFDLSDLIQPAGEALTKANVLVSKLGPMLDKFGPALDKLSSLGDKMSDELPPLMTNANKFLTDGDSVLANFNTPDGKKRLNDLLNSLRVSMENLKVVTTNAKALTQTLAEKPWRVIWGGSTVKPPPENEVLDSNRVIKLKPDVDVDNDRSVSPTKGQ